MNADIHRYENEEPVRADGSFGRTGAVSATLRLCGVLLALAISLAAQPKDYAKWVNPFIGTGGHGHTFPGATMPFGMVQLSPDTRVDNWDGSSGYHYSDDVIYGFSHTHLSGTGIPDGCDILFMPTVGELDLSKRPAIFAAAGDHPGNGYASKFSHANERAEPGFYSVKLDDDGLLAELTSTRRVGLHRYTFPRSETANIVLDLKWRDKVLGSQLRVVDKKRIEGYRRSSSWAKDQTVYFVAEFSMPFIDHLVEADFEKDGIDGASDDLFRIEASETGPERKEIRSSFRFKTKTNEQILLKVALSSVSIEGARKNLEAELPGWDFDKVRFEARAAWNKELSKIDVSGGTDAETTNFYTALYHTMIHPNVFNDVDGQYRGHDGRTHQLAGYDQEKPARVSSPHVSKGNTSTFKANPSDAKLRVKPPATAGGTDRGEHYTVFSLWDTFRAAHPLYTIIDQKRTVDFINTFIRQYEQGGRLPVWELWGEETDTMIGYHAVSVIADAMAKGIKGFDYDKAYAAAKHSAELDHYGLAAYKRRGYISMEEEQESVSKTLEYAYNDWCIMSMASLLFNRRQLERQRSQAFDEKYFAALTADVEMYRQRAASFENLFDTETRFFRPKQNGAFIEPFAPEDVTFHFTEGNSWQYSFFVPHDVSRLIQLMGGTPAFTERLDELFTTDTKLAGRDQPDITGLMGQYAHGNEPSHHIAYLYNYAGAPSKTQKRVRQIMDEFYRPTPDGLIGNEDCGQMSAWYVLSASGFYPVLPGTTRYDLGTPLFREVTYNLENGKRFTVRAPRVSPSNIYIRSAKWNGEPHLSSYITHEQIAAGGILELDMGSTPNDKAFSSFSTSTVFHDRPAVPVIDGGSRWFRDKATVTLRSTSPRTRIQYMVRQVPDGKFDNAAAVLPYDRPFVLPITSTVRARSIDPSGRTSLWAEARFFKKPNDWTISIDTKYNRQYTGGGDEGLIDGIRGTTNFASGEWQGYQPDDLVATIYLQRPTVIRKVGGGFLQVARSWIWMPTHIYFEASDDGVTFRRIADIKTDVAPNDMKATIRDYVSNIRPVTARYVRVRASNLGKIPAWHPGAGNNAFIFVDEIIVE